MMIRNVFVLLACVLALPGGSFAAGKRYSYQEEQNTHINEVRDGIDDLRHEVNNHEAEMRTFSEKLDNLDNRLDSLLQQIENSTRSQKDLLKGETGSLEERIASLESLNKGIVSDLKMLKAHANDSAVVIGQYKQKLVELEKLVESQNRSLDALQGAVQSLAEAMQVKAGGSSVASRDDGYTGRTYKVKPGDSLEKIARLHQTSIQSIKDANSLAKDRIVVGQTLKIPE